MSSTLTIGKGPEAGGRCRWERINNGLHPSCSLILCCFFFFRSKKLGRVPGKAGNSVITELARIGKSSVKKFPV